MWECENIIISMMFPSSLWWVIPICYTYYSSDFTLLTLTECIHACIITLSLQYTFIVLLLQYHVTHRPSTPTCIGCTLTFTYSPYHFDSIVFVQSVDHWHVILHTFTLHVFTLYQSMRHRSFTDSFTAILGYYFGQSHTFWCLPRRAHALRSG